jgi:hypothetical protein
VNTKPMNTKACPICETVKPVGAFHQLPQGRISRGCQVCVLSPQGTVRELNRLNKAVDRWYTRGEIHGNTIFGMGE